MIISPLLVVRKFESSFSSLNNKNAGFCFLFFFRKGVENLMMQLAVVLGTACDALE